MLLGRVFSLRKPVQTIALASGKSSGVIRRCCRRHQTQLASKQRQTLIILGTGWGSFSVLRSIDKSKFDVIVVSPRNHFLFTPLLCSTTVGTLEFRSIIEPIRNTGFRRSDHFHLAAAVDVDFTKRTVLCESTLKREHTYSLNYDVLVIGVGALSNTFRIPGVVEHAHFLKEVTDARKIRNKIIQNFELALQPGIDEAESKRLLHIVIVGGGPTGVEFGAELYDFIEQDVTRLYNQEQKNVQVTLIESQQILGAFDKRLRSYAEKKIRERDRFNLVNAAVVEVSKNEVRLSNGVTIPCGLVVWSTGLSPRAFTRMLKVQRNSHGQILTNKQLQVLDTPPGTVYAIGDCADIVDCPLPCTAQVAERQGRYVANYLSGKTKEQFSYKSLGMLTYIGGYRALTETPDVKIKGFTSWFLWRSAYLTRLGSWRLRMQVPMDWLKTLLFGRDVSRF